ncbi:hypothetical protein QPK87_10200 [Kamptonema cortianum]|nr:hypothetical protein [Geitlerinema splendidum]MDK3156948.1 hypothetical protein [Kamptonema cortianum]
MLTPYDWQEGMGHRSQFVESRLQSGVPVAAVSIPEGILLATFRYQSSKVFEIYDRLAYSALGMQSDVEAIRVAAVEFTHHEGFRRSEDDVTIQRLVTHLSEPLKKSFGDFRMAPVVIRGLFCEVNESIDKDRFYVLDYDGDYHLLRKIAFVAGSNEARDAMVEAVDKVDFSKAKREDALAQLREAVLKGMDPDGGKAAQSELQELTFEAAILRRDGKWARRYHVLTGKED